MWITFSQGSCFWLSRIVWYSYLLLCMHVHPSCMSCLLPACLLSVCCTASFRLRPVCPRDRLAIVVTPNTSPGWAAPGNTDEAELKRARSASESILTRAELKRGRTQKGRWALRTPPHVARHIPPLARALLVYSGPSRGRSCQSGRSGWSVG